MKRLLYKELIFWKRSKRRKPLVLFGARQTGKTYLLNEFGRKEFQQLHTVNFENNPEANRIFSGSLSPQKLLPLLELYLRKKIDIGNDLLFFDEIQECPQAVTSLKYFQEELPQLTVCCAGSYMGLYGISASFPVGKVNTYSLYPMTFAEYLEAVDEELAGHYFDFIETPAPIPDFLHRRLQDMLLRYFWIGGMPEAVGIATEDPLFGDDVRRDITEVHKGLVTGYRADFAKHSGKVNALHLHNVFEEIPRQLSAHADGNASRFSFKGAFPGASRFRDVAGVLHWLSAAGLVHRCRMTDTADLPLLANTKESLFKLYLLDCGLLHHMLQVPVLDILQQGMGSYKGYIAENAVVTQLAASGFEDIVCYKRNTTEVEFLIPFHNRMIPIEVKSASRTRRAKSLNMFCKRHKPEAAVKLSGGNFGVSRENGSIRLQLPLYTAADLQQILRHFIVL